MIINLNIKDEKSGAEVVFSHIEAADPKTLIKKANQKLNKYKDIINIIKLSIDGQFKNKEIKKIDYKTINNYYNN